VARRAPRKAYLLLDAPAAQDDAVDGEGEDANDEEDADVEVGDLEWPAVGGIDDAHARNGVAGEIGAGRNGTSFPGVDDRHPDRQPRVAAATLRSL